MRRRGITLAAVGVVVGYGLALAGGVIALQWLEYQYLARRHPVEIYVALVAVGFLTLGVFVGARLSRRTAPKAEFDRNTQVIGSLGVSQRELEVLEELAAGRSNKEIAGRLNVSPNTVKTHVARLYEKLDVSRRTQAVQRARELGMIP